MFIIFRRKRVSELAATHWPSKRPKFNTPEMKSELLQFATQIAPKCEMLEIGFNLDAIMEHVKCYFNEQRRYGKQIDKKVFSLSLLLPDPTCFIPGS